MASTDLVPAGDDSPYAVLRLERDELKELIEANLSPGETLGMRDLRRVKVPGAGGTTWEIPTLRGTETSKELVGVIIRADSQRAYWAGEFDGSNDPPDCASDDMIVGVANTPEGPGMNCADCPMNQFGSAKGAGKACKETRVIFMIPRDSVLPIVLQLPPGSLGDFKQYRLGLMGAGSKMSAVETRLQLEKATSKPDDAGKGGGIAYAKVIPLLGDDLSPAAAAQISAWAQDLEPAMTRAAREVAVENPDNDDDSEAVAA